MAAVPGGEGGVKEHHAQAKENLRRRATLPDAVAFSRSWGLTIEEARKMIRAEEAARR